MTAGARHDEDAVISKGRSSEENGTEGDGISSIAKPVSRLYHLRSVAQGCKSPAREVMPNATLY